MNLPWQNSWFQLASFVAIFSGGLLLFDLMEGRTGHPASTPPPDAEGQAYQPPAPSTPPSDTPTPQPMPPPQTVPPPSTPGPSAPSAAEAATAPITAPPATGAFVNIPGVCTYQAPDGWVVRNAGASKMAVDMGMGSYTPTIGMAVQSRPGALDDFVNYMLNGLSTRSTLRDVQVLSRVPFTTDGGSAGERVIFTATAGIGPIWEHCYFFDAGGSRKVAMVGTCKLEDGPNFVQLFDGSARTLVLAPPGQGNDAGNAKR